MKNFSMILLFAISTPAFAQAPQLEQKPDGTKEYSFPGTCAKMPQPFVAQDMTEAKIRMVKPEFYDGDLKGKPHCMGKCPANYIPWMIKASNGKTEHFVLSCISSDKS